MNILNKISKEDQHTYGLILRVLGTLMWVYITAPVGAFVVIVGEIITWINFDDEEPCSYHGERPLTLKETEEWKKKIERQLNYSKYKRK